MELIGQLPQCGSDALPVVGSVGALSPPIGSSGVMGLGGAYLNTRLPAV